jgi:hypothetical protein
MGRLRRAAESGWIVTTARNKARDRLRLIFTGCHTALTPEAQVALSLRLVAGLLGSRSIRSTTSTSTGTTPSTPRAPTCSAERAFLRDRRETL